VPGSDTEADDIALVEKLLASGDPWSRHLPVHVTCSALVVHPASARVLLRWHERQQAWLQVGGHADPGETDPLAIARREGVEETGLTDLVPWPTPHAGPVHLVLVDVPAGKGEPAHQHADLRYVLATEHPDDIVEESAGATLRWLSVDEAYELIAEDNLRVTLDRVAPGLRR
jgi:8-oxo-dGTP pyrophosphatase MutT (NUDIX family)